MNLVLIDVMRVQTYIFSPPRLREQVVGSYLIEAVLDPDLLCSLADGAELVYSGGGTAALLMHDESEVRAFSLRYRRRVMEMAPGLEVEVIGQAFEETDAFGEVLAEAQENLARAKAAHLPMEPVLAPAVVATDSVTGEPATAFEEVERDQGPVLLSAQRWRRCAEALHDAADRRFYDLAFPAGKHPRLPDTLDEMVEQNRLDRAFMAVVHIDGNEMGRRIHAALEGKNRWVDARDAWKQVSAETQDVGTAAVRAVTEALRASSEEAVLRLRFLVFGGDDLTFVCRGDQALQLVTGALTTFHQAGVTASAGVAFVKTHYPMVHAYRAAEQLCRLGKRALREADLAREASALDWMVLSGGLVDDIEALRERQLRRQDGSSPFLLTGRPYIVPALSSLSGDPQWSVVESIVRCLQQGTWVHHRTRLKGLPRLVAQGPRAFSTEIERWKKMHLGDEELPGPTDAARKGFLPLESHSGLRYRQGCRAYSPYPDAIELMDLAVFAPPASK